MKTARQQRDEDGPHLSGRARSSRGAGRGQTHSCLRARAGVLGLIAGLVLTSAAQADLRVYRRRVDLGSFPKVRLVFSLSSPVPMEFGKLTTQDLSVVEEELPIQDLELHPYEPRASVSLVLDSSGSIGPLRETLEEAAMYLATHLGRTDELAVVQFDRVVRSLAPISRDPLKVRDAISSLRPYGATDLSGGLHLGLREALRGEGRPVIILVSDGRERRPGGGYRSSGTAGLERLLARARRRDVRIHTVALGDHARHALLEDIAASTGGLALRTPGIGGLRQLLQEIALSSRSTFLVSWTSPRIEREDPVREVDLQVRFNGQLGRLHLFYRAPRSVSAQDLAVKRTPVWKDAFGRLELLTTGLLGEHLPMDFRLYDRKGRLLRRGQTTPGGHGRQGRDGIPELYRIPSGTYTVILNVPGTDLEFHKSGVKIAGGTTTRLNFPMSKITFRRGGRAWFDTEHALGDTSDLVRISINDESEKKRVYTGLLSDFSTSEGTSLWLPEGLYRIQLDNLLRPRKVGGKPSPSVRRWSSRRRPSSQLVAATPLPHAAILRNALSSRFVVAGGDVMYFDVQPQDFIEEVLPLEPPRLTRDSLTARSHRIQQLLRHAPTPSEEPDESVLDTLRRMEASAR